MKTTVQALKELYATLGGDLADVALIERIPEMIEALNSIAVAVPSVTAADAGKVLTVSDAGAWEAAAASGGGGSVIIDVNVSELVYPAEAATTSAEFLDQNDELIRALADQVTEAYSTGKNVYLRAWNNYDDEEKGIRSQNPNIKSTFMLTNAHINEGEEYGVEYLFASVFYNSEVKDIVCISTSGTNPQFAIRNSGLYYRPWVK